MYRLEDIGPGSLYARSCDGDPFGPKEGRGFNGLPYTVGIWIGTRCVFRFRQEALRPTASGTSFAEAILTRLNNPTLGREVGTA